MLDIDALLSQAVPLHQAGNLEEACAIYRRILEADPRHPYTLYSFGVAALQRGENVKAIECFRRSLAVEPHRIDGQFYYGLARFNLDQHEQAAEAFEKTIRLDPNHARAFCLLGNCRTALGQYREGPVNALILLAAECSRLRSHQQSRQRPQARRATRPSGATLPICVDVAPRQCRLDV